MHVSLLNVGVLSSHTFKYSAGLFSSPCMDIQCKIHFNQKRNISNVSFVMSRRPHVIYHHPPHLDIMHMYKLHVIYERTSRPPLTHRSSLAFIDKNKHTALTCLRPWYLSGSGSNPRSTLPGHPKLWMPIELHPVQFASSLLDKYLSLHKLKVFQDIPVETH